MSIGAIAATTDGYHIAPLKNERNEGAEKTSQKSVVIEFSPMRGVSAHSRLDSVGWFYGAARALISLGAFLARYQIQYKGLENIPANRAAVVVSNHLSQFDPPLLGYATACGLKRPILFLAKAALFKSPFMRWIMNNLSQIPMNRSGGKESQMALNAADEALKEGRLVGAFPEGTRTSGDLHKFHTGPIRLALDNQVPVIPVSVKYSRLRAEIEFGAPINVCEMRDKAKKSLREITDSIKNKVQAMTGQKYVDQYAGQKQA